jgi:hypothetical protein
MQFRAGHGVLCPYACAAKTAGETPALRNQRQRLPGSMKLNRPLQKLHQQQRQRRPAKAGRCECKTTINGKKPARRRRYEINVNGCPVR